MLNNIMAGANCDNIDEKTEAGNVNIPLLTTIDLSDPFGEKEFEANENFLLYVSSSCFSINISREKIFKAEYLKITKFYFIWYKEF